MNIIPELMNECLNTIASHYAEKGKGKNIKATEEDIQKSVSENWTKIQQEAMSLYLKAYKELQKQVA